MLMCCPECGLQVSNKAVCCPHCGYPMKSERMSERKQRTKKRKRLPNGFGQISEIKGKNLRRPFRAMVTVGKTIEGRPICKPLKPESYFLTYNDAYAALVEYNKNPYDLDLSMTVKELHDLWSKEFYKGLKLLTTANSYERAWKFCTGVYNMQAKDLRVRHIRKCMEEGTSEIRGEIVHANPRTQALIKTMFNNMLDYAVEYEIVDQNYSRSFSVSKEIIKENKKTIQGHMIFSDEEIDLLWKNINNYEGIDTILIQCYSGWRPKEIELLRLENVDLDNWTFKGGVKTEAGRDRTVPIHPRIRELVTTKYHKAEELDCEYLFTCPNKKPPVNVLTYDRYKKQFNKIKTALNLNPEHRPHDGRKHFVTMAKKYHVDEYAIKYMVGHVITDITENTYTERNINWLHDEIQKIV